MANIPIAEELIKELGLDAQSSDEIRELLTASGNRFDLDELLDGPFREKRRLRRPPRFSDGSFPVFYSSLDPTTAEMEVQHWFTRFACNLQMTRTAYYQRFSYTRSHRERLEAQDQGLA